VQVYLTGRNAATTYKCFRSVAPRDRLAKESDRIDSRTSGLATSSARKKPGGSIAKDKHTLVGHGRS
jgi:hypothetical protein